MKKSEVMTESVYAAHTISYYSLSMPNMYLIFRLTLFYYDRCLFQFVRNITFTLEQFFGKFLKSWRIYK